MLREATLLKKIPGKAKTIMYPNGGVSEAIPKIGSAETIAITPLMVAMSSTDRWTDVIAPQPASSLADGAPDALPSDAPAPHAYTPASSQYPHDPAESAHSSDPLHAPPCASRSYAAAY